jgi:hypothetical protein
MWCGSGDSKLLANGLPDPCALGTIVGACLAAVAAASLAIQIRRLRALVALGPNRRYLWEVPGASTPHAWQIVAASILSLLHAAACAWYASLPGAAPYLRWSHACLMACWAAVVAIIVWARHRGASTGFAVLAWTAAIAYGVVLCAEAFSFFRGDGVSPFQRRMWAAVFTAMAAAAAGFFVAEKQK